MFRINDHYINLIRFYFYAWRLYYYNQLNLNAMELDDDISIDFPQTLTQLGLEGPSPCLFRYKQYSTIHENFAFPFSDYKQTASLCIC